MLFALSPRVNSFTGCHFFNIPHQENPHSVSLIHKIQKDYPTTTCTLLDITVKRGFVTADEKM